MTKKKMIRPVPAPLLGGHDVPTAGKICLLLQRPDGRVLMRYCPHERHFILPSIEVDGQTTVGTLLNELTHSYGISRLTLASCYEVEAERRLWMVKVGSVRSFLTRLPGVKMGWGDLRTDHLHHLHDPFIRLLAAQPQICEAGL